ncbi:MAG: imidazoleglycerol-phosphate dehydratase HisB [Oscillospiraceae bacterium]|nr:imidazoleglycerol-phosphate dehydratase HisB [Oscillospiraceae bacterium]
MRQAEISRKTKETDVRVSLNLDGGAITVDTGIGFFDHMLHALLFYAGFGGTITCKGDLYVDGHHSVEDVGITLGMALKEALGDKIGIVRFAHSYVPMDESLEFCAIDVSGRPYLVMNAPMPQPMIGDYDSCLTKEFMRAFSMNSGITLHLGSEYGENAHHITEGLFKALGLSLKTAVCVESDQVTSTKGALA